MKPLRLMRLRAAAIPPVVGDPFWDSVSTLLHFDGTDGAITFTDLKGRRWTRNGVVQIDTAASKFGGASCLFGGTNEYLTTPNSSDLEFGSGDFTIELWVRPTTLTGANFFPALFGKLTTDTSDSEYLVYLNQNNSGTVFQFTTDGTNRFFPGNTIPLTLGQFHHIAVSRVGNDLRVFTDGVAGTVFDMTGKTLHAGNATAIIGRHGTGQSGNEFNGWIDEVRVTKGVGRYTTNFTPPATAFLEGLKYWDTAFSSSSLVYGERARSIQSSSGWQSTRSAESKTAGKWYAELFILDTANIFESAFGVATEAFNTTGFAGESVNAWILQSSDNISGARLRNNAIYSGTAITEVPENSYMRVAIDYAAGKAWFGNPTQWYNGGDPAAGTLPTMTFAAGQAMRLVASSSGAVLRLNMRANEIMGVLPSGFSAWGGTGGSAAETRYRYWRVAITANNGNTTYTSIAEIAFREAGFETRLSGASSASTSFFGDNGGRGFDGNISASATWVSGASPAHLPSWIQYAYAATKPKAIREYGMWPEPGNTPRAPLNFTLEASHDGTTWVVKDTRTNVTGWAGNAEKTFTVP